MSRALKPIETSLEGFPIKRHFLENPDKVFGAGMAGTLVPIFGGCKAFMPAPLPPPDRDLPAAAGQLTAATEAIG